MAFVLIPHLAPSHESLMPEILGKASKMPVQEVNEGAVVEIDQVYIIRPNTSISLSHGKFHAGAAHPGPGGGRDSIDSFFVSLARDHREKAIGIILSGTASDGAVGIRAIKAEGGITFAQDDSAEFQGMPQAAIATGAVDYVLSPQAIAREVTRIANIRISRLRRPLSVNTRSARKTNRRFGRFSVCLKRKRAFPSVRTNPRLSRGGWRGGWLFIRSKPWPITSQV